MENLGTPYKPHRKDGITTDNDVDLILARRVKKITYELPSVAQQKKYQHAVNSGKPIKPLTPNTLSKRKPLTSFIDNFTMKDYHLQRPGRLLIKDRDFLHLLGEVNGSKYNYCSRPELEIFIIGMETIKYYDQIFHQESQKDIASRPQSAGFFRPRSATMMVNPTVSLIHISANSQKKDSENEPPAEKAEVKEVKAEEKKNEEKPSSNEANNNDSTIQVPSNIIPHKLIESSFNLLKILPLTSLATIHENQKYLTLLYDPMKNLIIISEKMEVELIRLLLACHLENLARIQELHAKEKPPPVAVRPITAEAVEQREKTPKTPKRESSAHRLTSPKKGARDSTPTNRTTTITKSNSRKTVRPTSKTKRETTALHVDSSSDKEGVPIKPQIMSRNNTATEIIGEIEEEIHPEMIEETKPAAPPSSRPVIPIKKDLILLQAFYYIGNEEIIYTLNPEKIRYWKRFYAYYLQPFFRSLLDSYSHQLGFISSLLEERMHNIDHHIEINQNKTILEDSQSEESDNQSVESLDKPGKKGKRGKKTAASKKKTNSMITSSNGNISDLISPSAAQMILNIGDGGEDNQQESEEEQYESKATIVRRNNIKPIFIPKENQNSSKKPSLMTSKKASSSSLVGKLEK